MPELDPPRGTEAGEGVELLLSRETQSTWPGAPLSHCDRATPHGLESRWRNKDTELDMALGFVMSML